jgi:hypothetical protein
MERTGWGGVSPSPARNDLEFRISIVFGTQDVAES